MNQVIASIITGVLGLLAGTIGFYYTNQYLEQKREYLSTKREQFQHVFAPLERTKGVRSQRAVAQIVFNVSEILFSVIPAKAGTHYLLIFL